MYTYKGDFHACCGKRRYEAKDLLWKNEQCY